MIYRLKHQLALIMEWSASLMKLYENKLCYQNYRMESHTDFVDINYRFCTYNYNKLIILSINPESIIKTHLELIQFPINVHVHVNKINKILQIQ